MQAPLMIAAAPNGARKTKADHARLPILPSELAQTAEDCLAAGCCMIHLHVRDENGKHSLEPKNYRVAIEEIRNKVGNDLIIQITTEAVGIYQPERQIEIVKEIRPEAASIALREFCPDSGYERQASEFFAWMFKERVAPQYILYDLDDIRRFEEFCQRGMIPGENHSVLLVLGRYTVNQESNPDDLDPLIKDLPKNCNWWLCAFGKNETKCMESVIKNQGHCRVGFENNHFLPDGEVATSNVDSIAIVNELAEKHARPLADAELARELMSFP